MGIGVETGKDKSIAQIDRKFKEILNGVTAENQDNLLSNPRIEELISEKRMLENKLAQYSAAEKHRKNTMSRLDHIFAILDAMKNHPLTYDDLVVRQILQSAIVESKQKLRSSSSAGWKWKHRCSNDDTAIKNNARGFNPHQQNAKNIFFMWLRQNKSYAF